MFQSQKISCDVGGGFRRELSDVFLYSFIFFTCEGMLENNKYVVVRSII